MVACIVLVHNHARAEEPAQESVVVREFRSGRGRASEGKASSRVDRVDMDERLARSAPDALTYEPGVFVQKSAHGQASPFIRGRTGQQTVILFDGIRLNTSTWRQGPNQYFFTVDSATVRALEVIRGGASTEYGSDAIAGAILAFPVEPRWGEGAFGLRPRTAARVASADGEIGSRFSLDGYAGDVAGTFGFGARRVGRLESAGSVVSPVTGARPLVPAFEPDGRTQLGTGFREVSFDGRAVYRLGEKHRLVAAAYGFRELDAPRTDQCPAPFAPLDECLMYDEQFRTLAYLSHEGDLGRGARQAKTTVYYHRQHERRSLRRPSSHIRNIGKDTVDVLGVTGRYQTDTTRWGELLRLRGEWGVDGAHELITSRAWTEFSDIAQTVPLSRGIYVDGANYSTFGAYGSLRAAIGPLIVRSGARGGFARAYSPADPASGSVSVLASWPTVSGYAGVSADVTPWLQVIVGYDHSFRAPNLDDLTGRQQTGPGFQFENPSLRPERGHTVEIGGRVTLAAFELDVFAYRALLQDAIARAYRPQSSCPPATPQCGASWSRLTLVNLTGTARLDGFEVSARGTWGPFRVRGALSYAWGDGDDPANPRQRVPLSRVAPINGSLEARYEVAKGWYVGSALRFAGEQTRIAPTDRSDARIPDGGTPGYAILDLRAGMRLTRRFVANLAVENVMDTPYRNHGSSVNGSGRGIVLAVEAGL